MLKFDFDVKKLDIQNGITTGFGELDIFLNNASCNDCLITIGGRPAMGKTSFALSICNHLLKENHRVLYISLDCSKHQIEKRFLENNLKTYIRNSHHELLKDMVDYYKQSNLHIYSTTHLNISELEKIIKEIKPKYVFVDYIQLIKIQETLNLQEDINLAIYEIKRIIRENNLCMFLLSQLSRKPENRINKRPLLSDLKEVSILEELSDVILMIYRENYYDLEAQKNIAEIIVRKNNSGLTGYFCLGYENGFFDNSPRLEDF